MDIGSGLSRHTGLDTPQRLIQFFFTIWPVKLAWTICYLIYHVKDGYKQTQSVGYSTNIDTVMFYQLTSKDSKHYVLANLLC